MTAYRLKYPNSKIGQWKRVTKYPFDELGIGGMLVYTDVNVGNIAANAARIWGRRHGARFSGMDRKDFFIVVRVS